MFPETNVKSNRFVAREVQPNIKDLGEVLGTVSLDINESNNFRMHVTGSVNLIAPDESIFQEITLEVYNEDGIISFPPNFRTAANFNMVKYGSFVIKFRRNGTTWHQVDYIEIDNESNDDGVGSGPYGASGASACYFCMSMNWKRNCLEAIDHLIPDAGPCIGMGYIGQVDTCMLGSNLCYGPTGLGICHFGFPADLRVCGCGSNYLGCTAQWHASVPSYNHKYIMGPPVAKYTACSRDGSGCLFRSVWPTQLVAVKKPGGGYNPLVLVPPSWHCVGLGGGGSACSAFIQTMVEGINDCGSVFVSKLCYASSGCQKCIFIYQPSSVNCCSSYFNVPTVDLTPDYPRRVMIECPSCTYNYIGTAICGHLSMRYWVSPCAFLMGTFDTDASDTLSCPCTMMFKNVCPSNYPYCYKTCGIAAYLIPTMKREYYLTYNCSYPDAGYSMVCLRFGVARDCTFDQPTAAPCITQLFGCTMPFCTDSANQEYPGFGGAVLTCDGCYLLVARIARCATEDTCTCWYKCTCIQIYCRCASSCQFCTTPTDLPSAYTDASNFCGVCGFGPLHLDGACYTNRLAYKVMQVKKVAGVLKYYYLCHNGTSWGWDACCICCYSPQFPLCSNVPSYSNELHLNALGFFNNCYMRSGGNCSMCWISSWGKQNLNTNHIGNDNNGFKYYYGTEVSEKRTTNPELQPFYYNQNQYNINTFQSQMSCYPNQVIEPRPVAKPYKNKCRGGW